MEKSNSKLQYFVLICNPKQKGKFFELLSDYGVKNITTVSAHGSVPQGVLAKAFGLESTDKKLMLSALIPTETAKEIIDILYNEFKFNKPNTGIAYTIPVEGLLF